MELIAVAAVFVLVFLLVSKLAGRKKNKKTGPTRAEAAIESWAKEEVSKLLAAKLSVEESDMLTTLDGNPDPDLVTRVEKLVSGVEVVYERALGASGMADVRVEVRFDSGDLARTEKRIPWAELPEHVKDEFAKTGTAHIYRPWLFPWSR